MSCPLQLSGLRERLVYNGFILIKLQETVKRQERKILELEKQNESLEEAVDSERRRVVQMNEEVGGARSILEGLEEECRCLR